MKKLKKSQFLQISIMLFGLFFGAGNLIFPPILGNQAGSQSLIALLGFSITAVFFPILGAIAVGQTEGLSNLSNRVGGVFAIVFTTAIYLSIGPGLGIPRAGSVPFEMAIAPYIPQNFNLSLARLLYTAVFFSVALWICLTPHKLVSRVGKYLTPILLLLILIMFFKVVFLPPIIHEPVGEFKKGPLVQGFLSGYDTMDAVAGLNFGFVVAMSIKNFGIKEKSQITKYTIKSGVLAGTVLFIVYAMLTSIGMLTSGMFKNAENGVVILTNSVNMVFGKFGVVLLAAIFTLACLTTCVGLITSGGEYFHTLFKKKLSYKTWVIIWTLFSFIMANFGLNKLLAFSVPLLTIIYPVSLVLIIMGITDDYLKYNKSTYVITSSIAVILPLIYTMYKFFKIDLGILSKIESTLPLADKGLSWLLPSLIALILLTLIKNIFKNENSY